MVNFFPIFVITSSVYTLVCISFERNRVILNSYTPRMTYRKLVMSIGFIWSFSFAISIPTLLEYSVQVHMHVTERNQSTTHISCISQASEKLSLSNALFVCIMSYVIPVVLMLKNYLQVAVFVWKRGRRIKDESDNSVPNLGNFHLLTHRVKLVKLLVLVAVIFAVSWLPYFITLLYAVSIISSHCERD